jgi:hypothetical protein
LRAQLEVAFNLLDAVARVVNLNGIVEFLDILTNCRHRGCKVCFHRLKLSTSFMVEGVETFLSVRRSASISVNCFLARLRQFIDGDFFEHGFGLVDRRGLSN